MSQEIHIGKAKHEPKSLAYSVSNEQIRIHAEKDCSATVELTVSGEVDILVHVHSNARLTVVCLQTEEATVTQRAHIAEGGFIHWKNISLAPVVHSLESCIEGPHANSTVDWIFYAKESEKQSITASNAFMAGNGEGEMTIKGVAEDRAHVSAKGSINIGPKGIGTNAYLTEDVLMLDGTAKVDAVPGLEIKTNDVKASHSATVSKVTPEDLFYFASRGIDEKTARQMYIVGFLGDLISNQSVLDFIENKYN